MTRTPEDDDVALKLLHTADWHLGRRFAEFDEDDRLRLTRARLDAVETILARAESHRVDAVLCAGDLFDDPAPETQWYEGLAACFADQARRGWSRPVFLLPGNHDPLVPGSVYAPEHPFRAKLPDWAHVVDREDFTAELGPGAVLHAAPCRSRSGERDLGLALPARAPGDERIRIGLVHGQTFEIDGHAPSFPIAADAAERRGFDYLALGDTHGYRRLGSDEHPMVYPGAPEPTRFGESGAGGVVLACFTRRGRRPIVQHLGDVGRWTWLDATCRGLDELRLLREEARRDQVVRLRLDLTLDVEAYDEATRIVRELAGTEAAHGRVGVLVEHSESRLEIDASRGLEFARDLPDVLRAAVDRLGAEAADCPEAQRALHHLYRLVRPEVAR